MGYDVASMGILVTILALSVVIFLHELGHFLVAKRTGIGISEFAMGMGPKLVSRKIGDTTYSLRLIPIGGFVSVMGLDSQEEVPDSLNFYHKPIAHRLLTILAGSITNILLGFFIFSALIFIVGHPTPTQTVVAVMPNSPAQKAGIRPQDRLLYLDNHPIRDTKRDFTQMVRKAKGRQISLTFLSSHQKKTMLLTPMLDQTNTPVIGVVLATIQVKATIGKALMMGAQDTWTYTELVGQSLWMLITGKASLKEMAGPVGIVQLASFGWKNGVASFFRIIGMISVSLGVANLLPIPALDGGHATLLIIEAIRKKRLPQKWESRIQTVGFSLLMALMVVIVCNDVFRWKSRDIPMRKSHL